MDFQQGLITTIHEYGVTKDLLKELNISLKKKSTAILIPCLYEEFERPALNDIKEVLKNLTGLNELVIALSAKTIAQVNAAKVRYVRPKITLMLLKLMQLKYVMFGRKYAS